MIISDKQVERDNAHPCFRGNDGRLIKMTWTKKRAAEGSEAMSFYRFQLIPKFVSYILPLLGNHSHGYRYIEAKGYYLQLFQQ
jgi:hypothetical protein